MLFYSVTARLTEERRDLQGAELQSWLLTEFYLRGESPNLIQPLFYYYFYNKRVELGAVQSPFLSRCSVARDPVGGE